MRKASVRAASRNASSLARTRSMAFSSKCESLTWASAVASSLIAQRARSLL